jgi:murein DD-endopeptidase MepM/ murein hydrolase activator NlpD
MRWRSLIMVALLAGGFPAAQAQSSQAWTTPTYQFPQPVIADGFDFPVGFPNAEGYYTARGLKPGHFGEDWNGDGKGNTDIGDPVYSTAHGVVVMAGNVGHRWGNLVIVRHRFWDRGILRSVESVYAHCDRIFVRAGQTVKRGQLVGTIGTGNGMYVAHLHFEIRNRLGAGWISPPSFRDYESPTDFINTRRPRERGSIVVRR